MFEVEGGMNHQTIYIPFDNFNPRWGGFSLWHYKYSLFQRFNTAKIDSIEYKYTKFDYIPFDVPNYVPGYFEFHFKDIKAYKLK